jgi:hypothetical protein
VRLCPRLAVGTPGELDALVEHARHLLPQLQERCGEMRRDDSMRDEPR